MTRLEKKLVAALNKINQTIFAKGAPHGSPEYFEIRAIAVEAIKAAGGKVE